jgi:hypothetical protein
MTLSLLCVFALLLVSVPCAMCAPQTAPSAAGNHAALAVAHCDDCCTSAQVASAAKSCCATQTPAAVSVIPALDAAPAEDGLPGYRPVVAADVHQVFATARAVHPPLLKTNLRI